MYKNYTHIYFDPPPQNTNKILVSMVFLYLTSTSYNLIFQSQNTQLIHSFNIYAFTTKSFYCIIQIRTSCLGCSLNFIVPHTDTAVVLNYYYTFLSIKIWYSDPDIKQLLYRFIIYI